MLNGKKIMISSCAGIGDLLMFTPSLRKIKELFPSCKLTFLCNSPYKDALTGLSYIDKVITLQRGKPWSRLNAILNATKQDYIIFTDWQPQVLIAASLFGVKHRAGIAKGSHSANKYFTKQLTHNVMTSANYAADTNALIFSEALGIDIPIDNRVDVSIPVEKDKQRVDSLLAEKTDYICLAPFANSPTRTWPNFQDFVERADMPVVVIGPPDKAKFTIGETSIMEMIEIIRRAKIFVGANSGPMHIAGALGVPCIALFGSEPASRWAPRGSHVISLNTPCSPCNNSRNCQTWECMRGITAKMVCDAVNYNFQSQ